MVGTEAELAPIRASYSEGDLGATLMADATEFEPNSPEIYTALDELYGGDVCELIEMPEPRIFKKAVQERITHIRRRIMADNPSLEMAVEMFEELYILEHVHYKHVKNTDEEQTPRMRVGNVFSAYMMRLTNEDYKGAFALQLQQRLGREYSLADHLHPHTPSNLTNALRSKQQRLLATFARRMADGQSYKDCMTAIERFYQRQDLQQTDSCGTQTLFE